MKQKVFLGIAVLASISWFGIKFSQGSKQVPTQAAVHQEPPIAAEAPQAKDIDRAITAIKQSKAADLAAVGEDLADNGNEEVRQSFRDYQQQQQNYDQSYGHYAKVQSEYQRAVHAAVDSNGSEVEAALAEVDASAKLLQEETDKLNAKAADFLEQYRRYTFDKFGLALN